jgi:hypothetical protein
VRLYANKNKVVTKSEIDDDLKFRDLKYFTDPTASDRLAQFGQDFFEQ